MTATLTITLTERELDALSRSEGLSNGRGVRKSIQLQSVELKLFGAVGRALADRAPVKDHQ